LTGNATAEWRDVLGVMPLHLAAAEAADLDRYEEMGLSYKNGIISYDIVIHMTYIIWCVYIYMII
jgi:hypothetical protein